MQFIRYRQFERHSDASFVQRFAERVPATTEYVFKEKVRGHHLALYVDTSGNVTAASKCAFLGASARLEQRIATHLTEQLCALHADLSKALEEEHYEKAAELRDKLRHLNKSNCQSHQDN